MKQITVDTYQFAELNDAAKEKAREWYRRACEGDSNDAEAVIDDAKECLVFLGYDVKDVGYSGFWSQGDGAHFTGTWSAGKVNVAGLIEHTRGADQTSSEPELVDIGINLAALAVKFPEGSATITQRGNYAHSGCTEFDCDFSDENGYHVEPGDEFKTLSRSAMDWVYRSLEKAYNYANEDAQIDENIEANEYAFTIDGKRSVTL